MSIVIGITGSFGSGKSTVAKMFEQFGAYTVDADKIASSLIKPSGKVYAKIIKYFGKSILGKNKEINKKRLSGFVFKEKSKLKLLNKLIHPEVIKRIERCINEKKKKKLIIVDAALLVESGYYKKIGKIVVVKTNRDKQVKRVMKSKKMNRKEILERIIMQVSLKKKLALADFIIDNSGSRKKTLLQVRKIWKTIRGELCQ